MSSRSNSNSSSNSNSNSSNNHSNDSNSKNDHPSIFGRDREFTGLQHEALGSTRQDTPWNPACREIKLTNHTGLT